MCKYMIRYTSPIGTGERTLNPASGARQQKTLCLDNSESTERERERDLEPRATKGSKGEAFTFQHSFAFRSTCKHPSNCGARDLNGLGYQERFAPQPSGNLSCWFRKTRSHLTSVGPHQYTVT